MAKPWKGHEWGAKKLREVLEWVRDAGIQELTVYAFSIQNFDRPKEEFKYLMDVFKAEAKSLLEDKRLMGGDLRIRFIGRTSMFPKDVQELMHALEEKTLKNTKHQLNFAMAYGGREEIIDAVKKLAHEVETGNINSENITEETIDHAMYIESKPDLIIRTGGEKRLSNFLNWQNSYSELFFIDVLWPDFSKENLQEILAEYSQRERRFGQ
jgi:tritrans,polycis-undecaprenyl-diphosphate synthase [geranylgeranyl-diphosphate specific]